LRPVPTGVRNWATLKQFEVMQLWRRSVLECMPVKSADANEQRIQQCYTARKRKLWRGAG